MDNPQIEAKLDRMSSDLHAVAAPVRFVGKVIASVVLSALFILLFPAIIVAVAVCWPSFASQVDAAGAWGAVEFLLWFFGSFAVVFWLYFLARLVESRKNGGAAHGSALKFVGVLMLSYALGAAASFAEPSPATFIRMFVAITLPAAAMLAVACLRESRDGRTYKKIGSGYYYRVRHADGRNYWHRVEGQPEWLAPNEVLLES